ncbi:MAG: MMPL family transporter [Gammaproteobacteria bacterium]|nr:MMPL family transporter [Gammaproteobacteria bacterium]MBT8133088.1 MMPL family transporter [Gammaproteobacteria bacterium]NNJ48966.1 MMPL family transporter [Gammaproteobacteria bacterium]
MASSTDQFYAIIRFRWLIIFISVLFSVVMAVGMQNLAFNPDSRVFFSKQNPQLVAMEELENSFVKNENIYIALRPKQGDVFNTKTLALVKSLSEACWQIPYSSRVDSITNFQHMTVMGDDLSVDDLVTDAEDLSQQEIDEIRHVVLNEHALVHHLINPSGTITGININLLKPGKSLSEVPTTVAYVRNMLDEFRSVYPQHDFYLTGSVPFDQVFSQVSQDDSATLVPLMYLIIIVGVGLLLRSFSASFVTLIVIGMSTVVAMGMMGHMGMMITSPTAVAPVIIMTLAIADSVHILATMFNEMRRGLDKYAAIQEALRINLKPVFVTSLTTAIGFLSMNSSDVPPFRELGNVVAVGVLAAFVFSVVLLPAIIAVLPIPITVPKQEKESLRDRFAEFVINNRKRLLFGSSIVMLLIMLGTFRIELNDNFIEYLDESYQIRLDTELIASEQVTGLDIIEYSVSSGRSGGISTPEYLEGLDKLGKWFEQQPDVMTVATFADIMKRLNQKMNGDDPDYYLPPDSAELAAQYLLLYELSLPYGLDLNNRIDIDKSKTRLTVIMKRTSAKKLRQLDERARDWMQQNLPASMYSYGSGLSVVFAHISKRNIDTMLIGISIALVLISLILIVALGSVKYGLLSLVPNLFPAILAFGVWGYLQGQVGLAVAVVAAISIGVVVDDTVHFLTKYLLARKEKNMSPAQAVKYSFNTVGTAIVITSIALAAGFAVLAFSGFYVNFSMGVLTVIAIVFALLTDFLFLPPLLIAADEEE